MNVTNPTVAYVVSNELVKVSSLLPSNKNRSFLVHSLVKELNLLSNSENQSLHTVKVVAPKRASKEDLCVYHDEEYIDFVLSGAKPSDDTSDFGIEDDCPFFDGLPDYISLVAGATLTAIEQLKNNLADVAICWDGGRHHAQKDYASGFCYVADCILAILAVRKVPFLTSSGQPRKSRVMYLDLDLHYSDAVSQCFYKASSRLQATPQVLTLSVHHDSPGFFSSSSYSGLPDPHSDDFDPFTLSLPLKEGASAQTYARIWPLIEQIKDAYDPDFVIVQCGVDSLAGDPCGILNWSIDDGVGDMAWCIDRIVKTWGCKVLLLGGGGYNSPNAARAWAHLTSISRGHRIPMETPIPDHSAFLLYAPSFTLDIPRSYMRDQNTNEYLTIIEETYSNILPKIRQLCQSQ